PDVRSPGIPPAAWPYRSSRASALRKRHRRTRRGGERADCVALRSAHQVTRPASPALDRRGNRGDSPCRIITEDLCQDGEPDGDGLPGYAGAAYLGLSNLTMLSQGLPDDLRCPRALHTEEFQRIH